MIASNETKLTYRESIICIVNQQKTLVVNWESTVDGSVGHLQVSSANWADGEVVRLAMETIDRCHNRHKRMKTKRDA